MMNLARLEHVNTHNEQFRIQMLGERPVLDIIDEDGDGAAAYLTEPTARWLVQVCWLLYGPKWMGVEA